MGDRWWQGAAQGAIVETFGATALIQRCQEHKRRNVIEHLPELRPAWAARCATPGTAPTPSWSRSSCSMATSLQSKHPGAAASLRGDSARYRGNESRSGLMAAHIMCFKDSYVL